MEWNGCKDCHSCKSRHRICHHELPELDEECKYWRLGKCYTCIHIDDTEAEWYRRGCETWCFGGCRKYHRDWKKSFEYICIKLGTKG